MVQKSKQKAPSEKGGSSSVELVKSLLQRFPDRSHDIVLARFGIEGESQKTLEEIGKTYKITRERVRQVIDTVLKNMKRHLAEKSETPLLDEIVSTVKEHSGLMATDDLLEKMAGSSERDHGAFRVLLHSMPGIKILKENKEHRETIVVTDFSIGEWGKVLKAALDILSEKNDVMSIAELEKAVKERLKKEDLTPNMLSHFLAPSTLIEENVFGRLGLAHWESIRPRGTRERAHLILKMLAKPLHFREIAKLIDEHGLSRKDKKTHPQTVHNELIKDKRFVLVGRGTYALSEWGYKRGTVREVIADILKENKKPMSREDLLASIMKVRQVKKSTVIINLNSFFTKVGKNIYTLKGK